MPPPASTGSDRCCSSWAWSSRRPGDQLEGVASAASSRQPYRLNGRVGIWESEAVLITLLALPRSEDSLSHQIGPRVPAYCSGIGKALLAHLEAKELRSTCNGPTGPAHPDHDRQPRQAARRPRKDPRARLLDRARGDDSRRCRHGSAHLRPKARARRRDQHFAIPEVVLGRRMKSLAASYWTRHFGVSGEMGCYLSAGGPERGKRSFTRIKNGVSYHGRHKR